MKISIVKNEIGKHSVSVQIPEQCTIIGYTPVLNHFKPPYYGMVRDIMYFSRVLGQLMYAYLVVYAFLVVYAYFIMTLDYYYLMDMFSKYIFMPPRSKIWGHIPFVRSVILSFHNSVILSETF